MMFREVFKLLFSKLPVVLRCRVLSVFYGGRAQVGFGAFVHPSVHMLGKNCIKIGSNSCVSEGVWLNVNGRGGGVSIEIGNNCFIGKRNFFTSGGSIFIGDYALTTIDCKFIGSSHKFDDPCAPYILTGTTNVDVIKVGVNCFFGVGVTVIGNVNIGHGSVIGASSLVLHDVPPFSVVVGNPAVVVKRYSFSKKMWVPASCVSTDDLVEMPCEHDYLEKLRGGYACVDMPWIAAGSSMGGF